MKQGFVNWNRAIASSMVLSVLMVITAGQAPAVDVKGELKPKEVRALVANAKTAADHLKLSRHYSTMAAKHEAEAKEHEALAAEYRRNPRASESKRPMAPDTAAHCDYYAQHCRNAAKEMQALAAAHEQMAKEAQK